MANGGWWAGCGSEVCRRWLVVVEAAAEEEMVAVAVAAVAAAVRLSQPKAFVDDVDII